MALQGELDDLRAARRAAEVYEAWMQDRDRGKPYAGSLATCYSGLTRRRSLTMDPRPPDCRKLANSDNFYRARVGDWRILCAVEDGRLIVLELDVAPRGGAYQP